MQLFVHLTPSSPSLSLSPIHFTLRDTYKASTQFSSTPPYIRYNCDSVLVPLPGTVQYTRAPSFNYSGYNSTVPPFGTTVSSFFQSVTSLHFSHGSRMALMAFHSLQSSLGTPNSHVRHVAQHSPLPASDAHYPKRSLDCPKYMHPQPLQADTFKVQHGGVSGLYLLDIYTHVNSAFCAGSDRLLISEW